jgi:hypothetical protein
MLQILKSQGAKLAAKLTAEKAQRVLREFNETVPILRGIGLGVDNISLKMGFPPEVTATLIGSVDGLNPEIITTLRENHKDNRTIVILLEAAAAAANFKDELKTLGFNGIKVDLRLGLIPSVKLGLMPVALPAGAAAV